MIQDAFDDLSKLRPPPGTYTEPEANQSPHAAKAAGKSTRKRKKTRSEVIRFIQKPVAWKERLTGASGPAHDLADELLAERFWTEEDTVTVSNALAARCGLSRWAKLRALKMLERRGLIRVEREGHRAPRATLLHCK